MSVYNELSAKNLDLLFCAMEWISLYWIGLWSKRAPTRKVLWTSSRWLNRLLYYFCIVPFGLWPRIPLRFKTYWLVRTFKFFPWILPNWFKPSFFFKKKDSSSQDCEDRRNLKKTCAIWAKKYCKTSQFVKKHCKKSCGLCPSKYSRPTEFGQRRQFLRKGAKFC